LTAGVIATPATALVGCWVKTRCVAVPGTMLNVELVASVSDAALAVNVYPVPALSIDKVENVAMPAAAAIVAVPDSVPALALVPIVTVTFPVKLVATLSFRSSAVTWTAGMLEPAAVFTGWTVNASFAAAAGVMVNAFEVAWDAPPEVAVSVYPVPALSMLKSLNVATPATAALVSEPDRVPELGFVPMPTVTLPVNVVTVFPATSCPVTVTAGVTDAPATVLVGCALKTSCASAPIEIVNAVLVAVVRLVALADSV
jgi:hypothetical protein